jgi:hypothetical protein
VKPPYIKDKRVFTPDRALKRAMGEAFGGTMSPEARINALIVQDLQDQLEMIRRRKEVQASEALRLGTVTATGDGVNVAINFARDASLTVQLTGNTTWTAAQITAGTATPIANLETWALNVLKLEGAVITDVIFEPTSWSNFRLDPNFAKAVSQDSRGTTMSADFLSRMQNVGAVLQGTLPNGTNLWVYQDWYVNEAGSEVPMFPTHQVVGVARGQLEGIQYQGAIMDHTVGFTPGEQVPKSWTQDDPSVRFLMSQSAPLVVPKRPNASYAALTQ